MFSINGDWNVSGRFRFWAWNSMVVCMYRLWGDNSGLAVCVGL